MGNLPLPSVLLANIQSLDNKIDELRSRIPYEGDIKNCNVLSFTESWLNDDITYSWQVLRCISKIEQPPLVRQGVAVYVYFKQQLVHEI